jgi:hypothetical protein
MFIPLIKGTAQEHTIGRIPFCAILSFCLGTSFPSIVGA